MKVEVRLRSDNERGLFAIEDIKKGELICILPIDYFQLDSKWYATDETFLTDKVDFRYGILCEFKTDPVKTELQNLLLFLDDQYCKCCLNSFRFKVTEIIGVSNPRVLEDKFIGHMINHYVDMSFLSESKYEKMSKEFCNVKVSSKLKLFEYNGKKKLGLEIKALKDIEKGKELYLSYGSNYWKKYSGKDKFVYDLDLLLIGDIIR